MYRQREEVERAWRGSNPAPDASATFGEAPGDRGTEIHLTGDEPLGKLKDALRRFKAQLETGELPRSDAAPEGERRERKVKQRPAQPLDESEIEKAET